MLKQFEFGGFLGYGKGMPEELANELLDDIDYHFNKVKCRKIEGLVPRLMEMVESEMEYAGEVI